MSAVSRRMHELLSEVVATAITWDKVSDALWELGNANLTGIDRDALEYAEGRAYESLVQAILLYAREYRDFEEMQRILHGNSWDS